MCCNQVFVWSATTVPRGGVAAHGNVLVFAVSFSRSSRLAVSAFWVFRVDLVFSSTPKENVSRPFFKNFVNQKKVEKSKAPLS